MVDGDQAQLGGQPDAGAGAELVGVQPPSQAPGRPGGEDGAGLVLVERAALAEHVDPPGVRRGRLEHRAGDQGDVLVRVAALGDDVRAEERRLVGELPGDRQAARLVEDREPVAALDLDGRGALAAHLGHQRGDAAGELLVGGGAGGGDGGADAAGGVRRAGHPGGELRRPVAGEDQVGVGVHEPGDHGAAAGVDVGVGVRGLGRRADPGDRGAVEDDRGVGDDAEAVVAGRAGGVVGDQLADVGDEGGRSRPQPADRLVELAADVLPRRPWRRRPCRPR